MTKNQILVLTGAKMVGKRFLSDQIAKQFRRKVLSLDLSKNSDRKKLGHPQLFFAAHSTECIIFESIEFLPGILDDILRFQSSTRKQPKFILTLDYRFESVFRFFKFPGKVVIKEVFPLSLLDASKSGSYSVWNHWLKGGFPGLMTAPSLRVLNNRISRIIGLICSGNTTLITGHQLNSEKLENCLQILSQLNGTVLNSHQIAKSLGVSSTTVFRYLKFLEAAMLIRLLPAFFPDGSTKRLIRAPKIYFRDTGILHYLRGIQSLRSLSKSIGQPDSWEAYVIEEVAKVLPSRYTLYYYRTQHSAEVQLIITKMSKSELPKQLVLGICIQPGTVPLISRGLRNCFTNLHTRKNYLLQGATPQHDLILNGIPEEVLTDLKSMNCVLISLPQLLLKLSALRL
ncbi:ATP-binding protein [Flavihumibacter sp. UBA7668]|uniref:ATP-binding protein n=1 Tax=Flavihumibacter sp. UBA7668 TaxID=1946542 RepID=UPI0025BB1143|nr:DUF4143 domain-containing protein [Flavihumibacter sp. UBA7668]